MLSSIFSVDTLWYLLLLLYIPACALLIGVVLLQKGKGMGFAGAFGMGGASEAVFGPRAVRSLPQKITYTMAALFMCIAMLLSMISGRVGRGSAPAMVPEEDLSTNAIEKVDDSKKDEAPADGASAPATPQIVTTPVVPAAPAPAEGAAPAPAPAPADSAATPAPAPAPAAETPAPAPAPEAAAPAPAPAPAETPAAPQQ